MQQLVYLPTQAPFWKFSGNIGLSLWVTLLAWVGAILRLHLYKIIVDGPTQCKYTLFWEAKAESYPKSRSIWPSFI